MVLAKMATLMTASAMLAACSAQPTRENGALSEGNPLLIEYQVKNVASFGIRVSPIDSGSRLRIDLKNNYKQQEVGYFMLSNDECSSMLTGVFVLRTPDGHDLNYVKGVAIEDAELSMSMTYLGRQQGKHQYLATANNASTTLLTAKRITGLTVQPDGLNQQIYASGMNQK